MQIVPNIWPTWAALSEAISVPYPTVHAWARRGIPSRRFPSIIAAAQKAGVSLTFSDLYQFSPSKDAA